MTNYYDYFSVDLDDYACCFPEWELERFFAKLLWIAAFIVTSIRAMEVPEKSVTWFGRLQVVKENTRTKKPAKRCVITCRIFCGRGCRLWPIMPEYSRKDFCIMQISNPAKDIRRSK